MRAFFHARPVFKNGASKHPDGICALCKRSREMDLKLLGGRPVRGTTGHLQSSVCRLQAPVATGAHNVCFQQVQDDKFVAEHYTPLTLDIQTGVVSAEDTV